LSLYTHWYRAITASIVITLKQHEHIARAAYDMTLMLIFLEYFFPFVSPSLTDIEKVHLPDIYQALHPFSY
jgi:hypothetical protein